MSLSQFVRATAAGMLPEDGSTMPPSKAGAAAIGTARRLTAGMRPATVEAAESRCG